MCPYCAAPVGRERIPLADHDEIGRKVLGQPWAIQSAIVTIAAHCTILTDKHPTGDVADLAGCISEACLELANALAAQPASPLWGITDEMIKAGTEAMIASDTPDGPAYTTLARACLSAALGVDGYVAPKSATTPTKDPKE